MSLVRQAAALAIALSLPMAAVEATVGERAMPGGKRIIVISVEGGFVPAGFIKSAVPKLVGFANGTVLVANAELRRPDLRVVKLHVMAPGALRALVANVAKASVPPKGGWGMPGVADVPDTRISLQLPGTVRELSVYALPFTNGVNDRQAKARRLLTKAIDRLRKAAIASPRRTWNPDTYEVWASTPIMNAVGDAAPAAVFCISMDGKVADVVEPSECMRPDGSRIDAWDYFLSMSKSFAAWPPDVDVPVHACTAVTSRAFGALLSGGNDSGRWILPSGQAAVLVFRPQLPGERACHRT